MNEDNPGPKNIKGDYLREIIICVGWGILCDLTRSSILYFVTLLYPLKQSFSLASDLCVTPYCIFYSQCTGPGLSLKC